MLDCPCVRLPRIGRCENMGNKAAKMGGKGSDTNLSDNGKPAVEARKAVSPTPKAYVTAPTEKAAPPPPPKSNASTEKRDAPAPPAPPEGTESAETADFSEYKLNTKLTIDDFELLKASSSFIPSSFSPSG